SFFFQAEDGIRDRNVTGVQTCALPIFPRSRAPMKSRSRSWYLCAISATVARFAASCISHGTNRTYRSRVCRVEVPGNSVSEKARSEERRVGREWRAGGWAGRARKKRSR